MSTYSITSGRWSALSLFILLLTWIACFTGIAMTAPLFRWTNLQAYLVFERSYSQALPNLARFFMLLFGPVYLVLANSIYDYSSGDRRPAARLGLLFGAAFTILSCLHYFVQLSAVRMALNSDFTSGMEHFVQANPHSVMTAIDMLGWTLFLGLSSLFLSGVFRGKGIRRLIRRALLLNGISCLMAGVGYILEIDVLTFVCINLLTGGALMVASFALFRWFGGAGANSVQDKTTV